MTAAAAAPPRHHAHVIDSSLHQKPVSSRGDPHNPGTFAALLGAGGEGVVAVDEGLERRGLVLDVDGVAGRGHREVVRARVGKASGEVGLYTAMISRMSADPQNERVDRGPALDRKAIRTARDDARQIPGGIEERRRDRAGEDIAAHGTRRLVRVQPERPFKAPRPFRVRGKPRAAAAPVSTEPFAASKGSVYAFTVYAAGRGVYCDEFSTVTDASQRMPATIPPTMARTRESADLAWSFIAGLKWGETSFAVMIFVRKGADSASYTRLWRRG